MMIYEISKDFLDSFKVYLRILIKSFYKLCLFNQYKIIRILIINVKINENLQGLCWINDNFCRI